MPFKSVQFAFRQVLKYRRRRLIVLRNAPPPKVAVAVKTLKAGSTVDEKIDFLSEAEMMKRFTIVDIVLKIIRHHHYQDCHHHYHDCHRGRDDGEV